MSKPSQFPRVVQAQTAGLWQCRLFGWCTPRPPPKEFRIEIRVEESLTSGSAKEVPASSLSESREWAKDPGLSVIGRLSDNCGARGVPLPLVIFLLLSLEERKEEDGCSRRLG